MKFHAKKHKDVFDHYDILIFFGTNSVKLMRMSKFGKLIDLSSLEPPFI